MQQLIGGIDQAPAAFSFDPQQALQSPSLQFQQQLGQQQQDRVAGLSGNLGSGQRLIGAQQFGQGLASQSLNDEFQRQLIQNQSGVDRFNQRLNRLSGLVDVGRGTGTALGQLGGQSSSNISNLLAGIGNTRGAGILGERDALNQGINALINTASFAGGGGFGGSLPGGGGGGAGNSIGGGIGGFLPSGLF